MRKERWREIRTKGEKIYLLAYADDLVLLAEKEEGMRNMIKRFEKYVKVKSLDLNVEKSKILRFEKRGRRKKTAK